jgi:uncharacterized Zn finger protein
MSSRLAKVLDRSQLRALAGSRSYERGEDYYESGCVERLAIEGDSVVATVQGTHRYRVELRPGEEAPAGSCSCPHAREGAFCKHCVAVGLAFLDAGAELPQSRPTPLSVDGIRAKLAELDRDALISLLVEEAAADARVLERLRLRFAADSDQVDVASFRRAIELAIDPGDFVPYQEAYDWSRGVEEVMDAVERLLGAGHPGAVIELSEYALATLDELGGLVDDSDGHVGVLRDRLEHLHLAACERGDPDPVGLAERLLRFQLESELEAFWDAAETYGDVLGEAGLARYAELASVEWEQVPELAPGDERDHRSNRFRITHVMEELARASGDVERVVAVLRRDLSLPYSFLRIAEAYREAGPGDAAIEWAERGIEAFPERPDPRLQTFLAEAYAGCGREADALEVAWDHYCDHPSVETYRALKPYAERVGEWPRRRERALTLLRKRARESREEAQRRGYWLRGGDHSELVRILLWEGDVEAAWREAEEGGCGEGLWLELAERRKQTHPEDALRVYRGRIEPTIGGKSKRHYEEAVGLIEEVGALLRRLGREEELPRLVAEVRAAHARKRNLVALLDSLRLEEVAP